MTFLSMGLMGVLIAAACLVVGVSVVVVIYNGLVRHRNRYRNAFAQIDVQLKRRHDLIPNLVESVKGYLKHERGTLEAVIAARSAASEARQAAAADPGDAAAVSRLASAEDGLGSVLGRLFALSEGYPELRSNENMRQLQEELASTENKVAFARQAHNDAVTGHNNKRETFPANLLAGAFHFTPAGLYEVGGEVRDEAAKVQFD